MMNKLFKALIATFIIFLTYNISFSQVWYNNDPNKEDNFYEIQKKFNDYWKDKEYKRGNGWKQFKRWENFWEDRVYPSGEFPNATETWKSYVNFISQENKNDKLLNSQFSWKPLGPTSIPINKLAYASSGLGRLNVVAIHPKNDNILWVGSSNGGAWKSTNKGQTWTLAKFTDILSLGISDIAISPVNPHIMYMATGDKNGSFMSNSFSLGILKSTNGGEDWEFVSDIYNSTSNILATRILINPVNDNIVYFSTSKGIFRSKDSGENWEQVYQSGTIIYDMKFMPENENIIYATSNQSILRSIDGGDNWERVYTFSGGSRIELAVTPKNPMYLYALGAKQSTGSFAGVVRSTDGGSTFTVMSTSPNILSIERNGAGNSGQGMYDLAIAVSPTDVETVYIGGIHNWKSTNGGKNWNILNHWTGSFSLPYVHADQHFTVINPNTSEIFNTNDGGIYTSKDGGAKWQDISSGLAISQFYRIDVKDGNIIGGTQDNGTFLYKDNVWYAVNGGDGMECAFDPTDDKYVYSTTQYGNLYISSNGGLGFRRIAGTDMMGQESADWIAPYRLNPQNPQSIYLGYRNLYKTTNRGQSWAKLTNFTGNQNIKHIAISETDTNIIYIAINAALYKSVDGGLNFTSLKNFPRVISGLAIDPSNSNRIFVSLSGYSIVDKVYEVLDKNATNITYNLPNVSVESIIVQKNTSGKLYIGTDIGVFVKNDDFSDGWLSFSEELPPASVRSLKISYGEGKLYAGTFGRGVWVTDLYDCDLEIPQVTVSGSLDFCTGDSVVLEVNTKYNQFKWSTGETTKSITIKKTGTYFVSVKNDSGCTAKSQNIVINELVVPSFMIKSNKQMAICDGEPITLTASVGFDDYEWSTGETKLRITVSEPGPYVVTAMSKSGCFVRDSVYIDYGEIPIKPFIYIKEDTLSTDFAEEYQWYLDDKPISGATSRTYVATKSGVYTVEIFSEDGCSNISDPEDIISSVIMPIDFSNDFKISPNPFNELIRIAPMNFFSKVEITISDLLGRVLVKDNFSDIGMGNDLTIQLNDLVNGTYILLINTEDRIYSYKINKY